MDESVDAEIQPKTWTLSSGAVLLFVGLVALLVVTVRSAASGVSANHLLGVGGFLAGLGVFIGIYRRAHVPVSTEAWFEGTRLVVRDPNPWWKRLTDPFFGWELRLVVQAVEWREDGPTVIGSPAWAVSRGRKFEVFLKPNSDQAPALRTRLVELDPG